jgi:hypothetical protein
MGGSVLQVFLLSSRHIFQRLEILRPVMKINKGLAELWP